MEHFDDLFDLGKLISGYLKNDLSDDDQQKLETWLDSSSENRAQFERLINEVKLITDIENYTSASKEVAWARIVNETGYKQNRLRLILPRIAVAASIVVVLSTGGYFLFKKQPTNLLVAQNKPQAILPGSNKATLTLANGKQILLTKNMVGKLAIQGQTQIQMANGVIKYAGANDSIVAYNTLTTKRKEQFPLVLADGTEVTLDASSSITYPVAFNGKERKVKITGQVYFKVAHNMKQPFIVQTRGQQVRDIGTEFNINAYNDEPIVKTTLIKGSVAVLFHNYNQILIPGQEADVVNNELVIKRADIDEATAWKNNLFHFSGVDLKTVMRQFSRWYDINVTYQGEIPEHEFAGEMSRNVDAAEAFEALGKYGLKFSINGKNVIVSKK